MYGNPLQTRTVQLLSACAVAWLQEAFSVRPYDSQANLLVGEAAAPWIPETPAESATGISLLQALEEVIDDSRSVWDVLAEGGSFVEQTGEHCVGKTFKKALMAERDKTSSLCKSECKEKNSDANNFLSRVDVIRAIVKENTSAALPCDDSTIEAIHEVFELGCNALTCLAECAQRNRPTCAHITTYNEWCQTQFVGKFTEIMSTRLRLGWYSHMLKYGYGSPPGECEQRATQAEEKGMPSLLKEFPQACFPSTCLDDRKVVQAVTSAHEPIHTGNPTDEGSKTGSTPGAKETVDTAFWHKESTTEAPPMMDEAIVMPFIDDTAEENAVNPSPSMVGAPLEQSSSNVTVDINSNRREETAGAGGAPAVSASQPEQGSSDEMQKTHAADGTDETAASEENVTVTAVSNVKRLESNDTTEAFAGEVRRRESSGGADSELADGDDATSRKHATQASAQNGSSGPQLARVKSQEAAGGASELPPKAEVLRFIFEQVRREELAQADAKRQSQQRDKK
mmetsp:Transcript_54639/g.130386  ORF Transcript_54639/g.130386 Transcript_54639/m.130386 type:complete len:512 (+) Transcript_54639:125-1660(+)